MSADLTELQKENLSVAALKNYFKQEDNKIECVFVLS